MRRSFFILLSCATCAYLCTSIASAQIHPINLATRSKTQSCLFVDGLPDSTCTPGGIFADATREEICRPGYSASVRNVILETKQEVYDEYSIGSHAPGAFEVDHLVPLELGGSNEISNLWPQPAEPTPGFHEKDDLENYLHDQVCNGAMELTDAQRTIANNRLTVYDRMPGHMIRVKDVTDSVLTIWNQILPIFLMVQQLLQRIWNNLITWISPTL